MGGVVVFEWQIAAHHGEQDDPATPDIDFKPMVLFAGDHLGCGVAGRPTGSLQHFVFLVGVAEAEVDNLEAILPVDQ